MAIGAENVRISALRNIETFSRKAASQGVELILFPELVVRGHNAPHTSELVESVPDGPSCQQLAALSEELKLVISAGLSERDGSLIYRMIGGDY